MITVFSFHRVHPISDNLWDPISPELFEKIIKYISARFDIQTLEHVLSNISSFTSAKKTACIVFDDGYKDNIEYAIPVLQKYKIRASFYVVTDCIDKQILTWTHQLAYTFQNTKISKIDLKDCWFLPAPLQDINWETNSEKLVFAQQLKKELKSVSNEHRIKVLESLRTQCDDVSIYTTLMMNWDDARKLISLGHIVGSHTVTHAMLGNITNPDVIKHELQYSAKRIADETSVFPHTISYPVGSYNQDVINLAKETGYAFGLAVNQRKYNPLTDDIYAVPRIELYNEHWWKTKLRISGTLEYLKKYLKK